MENKKLLKYLLKDLGELEEMFAERGKNSFDDIEIEFIQNRVSGAIKLVQMYLERVTEEKEENPVFSSQQKTRLHVENVNDFIPSKQAVEKVGESKFDEKPQAVDVEEEVPEVLKEEKEYIHKTVEVKTENVKEEAKPENEVKENTVSPKVKEHVVAETKVQPVQSNQNLADQEIQFDEEIPEEIHNKRLADKFLKEKSVNDSLVDDTSKLEHKISNRPVISIQSAIGINDRFQYIRELFEGSTDNFVKAVSDLDSMNDITEAVDYLQTNFKWKKNETSLKFVNLIKRRFPHG